jgi:selenophosphate synthetase-related protein
MTSITPSPDSPVPSQVPDTLSPQYLQAMQMVAKMKESADKHGVGFVGGFVSPDGKKFMMTNLSLKTHSSSYLMTSSDKEITN